jgi:hypothetical protein
MATKKLAIVFFLYQPMWGGVDISKPEAEIKWMRPLGQDAGWDTPNCTVINKKCLVTNLTSGGRAKVDVYDAFDGNHIKSVVYTVAGPYNLSHLGFANDSPLGRDEDREVELDLLVVPFRQLDVPLHFFCLKSDSFQVPDPTLKARYVDRLGSTDDFLAYGSTGSDFKIVSWSETGGPVIREFQLSGPPGPCHLLARTSPEKLLLIKCLTRPRGYSISFHQFDPTGRETRFIQTEDIIWPGKAVNESTLVTLHSGQMKFISLNDEDGLEEVSKVPEIQVPEGFTRARTWYLSTAAVAKFTKQHSCGSCWTVFVEIKFNPE